MSYLVLARKWRPQTFSEVVGQEHITETLKKAVEKDRVAHAYLFAGPRGCGKTTTARLLAKIINCEKPNGAEPCNTCSSCEAITTGRHLDVIEIDGASNRGIDEIRDLREKISYAPSQGRSKIYIIDEVHMLTPQAFNALLKTLEEPPVHVYLIFATTEPHKVPTTILSRCQRFNFKRLELKEIASQLEKICTLEKVKFEGEALTLIARRAEGSMRDGQSLLDQCLAAAEGSVDLALVRRVLGLVDSQLVIDLLRAIGERDRKGTLAIVDRAVDSGIDLEELFLAYVEGLRNLLVLSVEGGESADFLDLSQGEIADFSAIGKAFKTEDLLYLFRAAARVYRELKASGQPRYVLEAALMEAASWESAVEISELIRRLDSSGGPAVSGGPARERKADAGPSRPQKLEPVADEASEGRENAVQVPEVAPASFGAFARLDTLAAPIARTAEEDLILRDLGGKEAWERFLSQIRETKLTLGIWLMSARVERFSDNKLSLSFSPQNRFAREMVLEAKNRRFIEFHLERFFGRKLIIEALEHVESSGDERGPADGQKPAAEATKPRAPKIPAQRTRPADPALETLAGGAPVIKRLIEEFDGELFKDKS
ncbi:MAG: DNA polymerase III subunit gamma/tau [Candidatus Krumholzibacteria bacterium]|nr:DNA polymerase III subunit gamma/tau [Candidatus Krumholzibacteria bacterium]